MWPQQLLFVSRIAEKVNGHFYSSITVDTASKTRRDDVPVLGEYNRIRETHRQRGYAKQVHREGFGLRPMKFYELFAPLSSRRSLSHHVAAALLRLRCPCAEELHKRGRIGAPLLVVLGLAPDLVRQQNCNWAEAESGSSSDYISTRVFLHLMPIFAAFSFSFFSFFFLLRSFWRRLTPFTPLGEHLISQVATSSSQGHPTLPRQHPSPRPCVPFQRLSPCIRAVEVALTFCVCTPKSLVATVIGTESESLAAEIVFRGPRLLTFVPAESVYPHRRHFMRNFNSEAV